MSMKDLLRELTETIGGPGNEERIREVIRARVEDAADEVEVDALGNLIVRRGSGDRTLLAMAHMDQIGLSVERIDEDGYLRIRKIWGIDPQEIINQRVEVHVEDGDPVTGVIANKPVHLQEKDEKQELPEMEQLFVDVGARDEDDAREMGIRVGDYVHYDRDFAELGGDRVTAPAFDDRAGCAALIDAFNRFDGDNELVAVFSAQEEVGTKGAQTAAFSVDPDVGLAVDVTIAGDVPTIEPHESTIELGDGVEIQLIQSTGRGMIAPETVKGWMFETAEEGDHDHFRGLGGGNDARSIELAREGVPTGSIGIPARHIHSPVEVVSVSDVEAAADYMLDLFGTFEDHF